MEETWSVPDVYLLTEGPDGTVAVPRLTLCFLPERVALATADGEPVWDCAWEDVAQMSPDERAVLPDGSHGVVIVVVERGERRRHRFAFAADDPVTTEASVRNCAAAHGVKTRPISARSPVSPVLTIMVVVAVLAVMTALLLSATHVIHF